MVRLLSICFALSSLTVGFAQKPPIKFGDVSQESLDLKIYPPDSTADAVVLMDYGVSAIVPSNATGFELSHERVVRIKILTEAGKSWADFAIQLYHEDDLSQKLEFFNAVTTNLDKGKQVKTTMTKEAIFRTKSSRNVDVVKATLPNVRVGSVLDINYKVTSDFLTSFQNWRFQNTIPTLLSEYRAEIPEYYNYDRYLQGYIPLAVNEHQQEAATFDVRYKTLNTNVTSKTFSEAKEKLEYTKHKFRWVAINVPAFRDEPFMTSREDFLSRMNFELLSTKFPDDRVRNVLGTWDEINKRFAEHQDFLAQVNGNGSLRKIAEDIAMNAATVPEKIEAICRYVKSNVKWNGETRMLVDLPVRQVLEDRTGSSAEINLLIASLLQKLDISVRPVLLSTRDHGFIRDATPSFRQFNNVVCLVTWDGKQLLLDGTDTFLPTGFLPENCLNGHGMVVSKEGPEWIPLDPLTKTRSVTNGEFNLSPDGVLSGQLRLEYYGYDAAEHRQMYSEEGETDYRKHVFEGLPWLIERSEYSNTTILGEPFKQTHHVVINDHSVAAGNIQYIIPIVYGRWEHNPFKSETREYPVDFAAAFDDVCMVRIRLPDGYVVDEMPKSKMFMMPGNKAKYILSAAHSAGVVTITSNLSVNESLFSSEEYPVLREFFNQVVAKQSEQIVIRKK